MKLFFACLLIFFVAANASPFHEKRDCKEALCFIHPCAFVKCPSFPKAKCVADYCGGCHARFYVEDNEVDCGGK